MRNLDSHRLTHRRQRLQPGRPKCSDISIFAERSIFDISGSRARTGRGGFAPLKTLLTKAVDRIDTLFRPNQAHHRHVHRLQDLDDMTSGCKRVTW